jgi:hypothetical protein
MELHWSLSNALITKRGTIKKILDILFLGNKETIKGRRNLNTMKIAKRTKIKHKKLLTETRLDKGNILRVFTSDHHVINIEKRKMFGHEERYKQIVLDHEH